MSAQADTNCHDIFNVVSATRTHLAKVGVTFHVLPTCRDMSVKFSAKRPVVRRPLSSLTVVVHPLYAVASTAACSPHVVSYRPLAQQHHRRHSHCDLVLPLPSLVARRAVHRPLLPQSSVVVDRPLRSSRFFVRHLLSFSSPRERMDERTPKMERDRSRHTFASRRTRQLNHC